MAQLFPCTLRNSGSTLTIPPTPRQMTRRSWEPACGAALAAIYSNVVQKLQGEGKLCTPLSSLVVIVCGGSNISLAQLPALKKQLGMKSGLPQ